MKIGFTSTVYNLKNQHTMYFFSLHEKVHSRNNCEWNGHIPDVHVACECVKTINRFQFSSQCDYLKDTCIPIVCSFTSKTKTACMTHNKCIYTVFVHR